MMKIFYSKKKKLVAGLFLGLAIFTGILSPIRYSSVLSTNGGGLINFALAQATHTTECGTFDFACHLSVFFDQTLPAIISTILLTVTAWFLGIAGFLLNEVISFTVVNMAQNIKGIDGINVAWKVMRDLANLGFIFILLYIAIGTILRLGGVNTKKLLVNVIIIALLLNFSLFFTKLLIDASNIITVGFYSRISNANGLSDAFMNQLGITSVYDVSANAEFVKEAGSAGKILLLGLFGAILFLITGFVFLAAALMFIIRYVTLIFLLIFSPLAFAAMALPNDKYSSSWWDKLWKNIIFAPVFMIMVWTVLTILSGILAGGGIGSTKDMLQAINKPYASLSMVMNFIIVIVAMVATLVVANEIGAAGAKGALKYGAKLRGKAQGIVGRGALRATPLRSIDKRLSESAFGQTAIGRGLRNSTTGALMNQDFGSGKSISKVDKGLKESREKYAKKQVENVTKAHEKQEDIRRNFNAVFSNPNSNIKERYDMHEKMLKHEKERLAKLEIARESAVTRKDYVEIKEIDDAKTILAQRIGEMETRQKGWDEKKEKIKTEGGVLMRNDLDISEEELNKITDSNNSGIRLKMAQRSEALKRQEGGLINKTGRAAGRVVGNSVSGAVVGGVAGGVMAGPLGAPIGVTLGALAGSKRGKKFLGKTKKYLYGEAQSARLETIKNLRDNAKKGKKGGGDKQQVKEALEAFGIDLGEGGDSGGGGESKPK